MKLIIQIMAFLAIFLGIYLMILNGGDAVTVNVMPPRFDDITGELYHTTKTMSVSFYTLAIMFSGFFAGICLVIPFYLAQLEQVFVYKRELERSSVKKEDSVSQVKVLQAKVDVLEKALKEALKNQY